MDFANDANAVRMLELVQQCLKRHTTERLAAAALSELMPLLSTAEQRNAFRLTALYLAAKYNRTQAQQILTWPLIGSFEQTGAEQSEVGETMRRAVVVAIAEGARQLLLAEAAAITAMATDALQQPTW